MSVHGKRSLLMLILASALVLAGVGAAAAQLITGQGGTIRAVWVASDSASFLTNNVAWTNVAGAAVTITVPRDERGLIIARFAAESVCDQPNPPQSCYLRILADGAVMNPTDPDYRFDTDRTPAIRTDWQGHAVERSIILGPGTYTVQVQARVDASDPNALFRLDDWHLSVERAEINGNNDDDDNDDHNDDDNDNNNDNDND